MKRLHYLIIIIISLFSISCTHLGEVDNNIFCADELSSTEENASKYNAAIATYQAVAKNNLSIWDADFLATNQLLATALKEFRLGKRGQLARQIKLTGKSAQEIHGLLLSKKFSHKQVPLKVRRDDENYWLKDGGITEDINDPNLVLMDIYVHNDGSMIRIKSFGIPDASGLVELRRMPHASKSVLKNLCKGKNCTQDTSFNNEAFKVTDEGFPIPKSSSPQAGLKLPYDNSSEFGKMLNEVVMDTNAVLGHINLGTKCKDNALIIK
jgi:hypothetical protein